MTVVHFCPLRSLKCLFSFLSPWNWTAATGLGKASSTFHPYYWSSRFPSHKVFPITSLLYSLYSLSTSDLNHQCLPTKAKMNQIPPYCRHISNPVLHHITTFPSSCIQAWLKLIHHPSRHQKNRHQDSSLYWHQHNGKNISWFSEHLNHRFS